MILVVCPNPSIDTFIHFEGFIPGGANRTMMEKRYPGGKGVHVALALKELGEKPVIAAFWGGENGKWIKEQTSLTGVRCMGPHIEENNRICYTFRTNDHFNETEILGAGPEINTEIHDQFLKEISDVLPGADVIVLSGSLPPGCPVDLYLDILTLASGKKIPVFLDCTGDPLRTAMTVPCEGVHLNFGEYRELFPGNDPVQASGWLASKSRFAAISNGKDGLYLTSDNRQVHASLPLENIRSAVGSGDCLLAGLVAARRMGYDLPEMARLGVACGTASCVNEELGLMKINDVRDFEPRVKIDMISIK